MNTVRFGNRKKWHKNMSHVNFLFSSIYLIFFLWFSLFDSFWNAVYEKQKKNNKRTSIRDYCVFFQIMFLQVPPWKLASQCMCCRSVPFQKFLWYTHSLTLCFFFFWLSFLLKVVFHFKFEFIRRKNSINFIILLGLSKDKRLSLFHYTYSFFFQPNTDRHFTHLQTKPENSIAFIWTLGVYYISSIMDK